MVQLGRRVGGTHLAASSVQRPWCVVLRFRSGKRALLLHGDAIDEKCRSVGGL